MNAIINELQQQKQEIEARLSLCHAEIKEAAAGFQRSGEGGEVWRRKFTERYSLSNRLREIDAQIRDAEFASTPAPGQAVNVFEGEGHLIGATQIQAIYQRKPSGYLVGLAPITKNSLSLAFNERGECVLPGLETFSYKPVMQAA